MDLFHAVCNRKGVPDKVHRKNSKKQRFLKNKEIHKNSQNNKIHKKLIMFWPFFCRYL